MIELVSGTHGLRRQVAPIIGIDRAMQRHASRYVNARLGQALKLRGIVGQKPHARATQ